MTLTERLTHYEKLMRLDKPVGILLLLWPTLWAQWLASHGQPDWLILWIFTIGVVVMRSAGCVINDYADRDFDAHVERTRERPLAAGKVSPKEALLLAGGLALLAFLLVLPLGKLVIGLSFVAVFLAASYPFTKRFFAIPQAYLGIAFGFGIPMSYAALWGEVPMEAWLLLTANVFWAIAYDTEYAMVDRADDLKIGIKTSAITFGRLDRVAIGMCYAATLALLAWVGWQRQMDAVYYVGLGVAAAIAVYHMVLIRHRAPQQCFRAFLHNTWFGAAVFGGIAMNYLLRSL
ncbi:MAG TPA: 4-hydroxybenzoate octaprenyltransferase [Thiobacillus sp.]|nr:MAG: 4-hydroxybenzoate polyprenyltransferase [Hydrogenophilales bacterium 16-61-112]OZA43208.1 MAG: 4-hydroxybenzoate polyprenyltransferase [Hydrogenophilales bacterium 17-61-76]HQT30842.1 4-hydroxybenzoate octaprenyltransferase [Thiobacillus sp.]HQT69646.1 4-hydroxybenzoate octaprenyltransferase [Thiobacillus sp.]